MVIKKNLNYWELIKPTKYKGHSPIRLIIFSSIITFVNENCDNSKNSKV